MLGILTTVAVMSVMLSIIGSFAFYLRSRLFSGREGMMYPFWVIILLISLLPLQLPTHNAITDYSLDGDIPIIVAADMFTRYEEGIVTPDGRFIPAEKYSNSFFGELERNIRRSLAGSAELVEDISCVLVILWIAGAVFALGRTAVCYCKLRRLFYNNSHSCTDEDVLILANKIRKKLGLIREVDIRVLDTDGAVSPFVVGLFSPKLYIDNTCLNMDVKRLSYILTHEFTHIKRFDIVSKTVSAAASAVHWFNPGVRRIADAMLEDCELSCDYSIIKLYGQEAGGSYMNVILDIASRYSHSQSSLNGKSYAVGLFAVCSTGADFLKRRYKNMKNYKKDRISTLYAALFCAIAMLASAFALSACDGINEKELASTIKLSEPLGTVVRAYYGITPEDSITPEMLDGVTSLYVAEEEHGGKAYYSYTVNHDFELTVKALPGFVKPAYYDAVLLPALEALDDPTYAMRFKAFYHLYDITDDTLDEAGRAEMIAKVPALAHHKALYVLDPFASERELNLLFSILESAGLTEVFALDARALDENSLAYFSNLSDVIYAE